MTIKKLFYIAIAGSVLCFCGDMLLGCFYPMEKVGIFHLFPAFSEEWSNATSIRFIIGGLLGVIALLLIFCGFYAISVLLKEKVGKYDKLFFIASIVFVSVGTLYHCVFAISAWLYNQLAEENIVLAKRISERFFTTFICVAFLAAISFIILSIIIFCVAIKGTWGKKRWVLINPLLFMGISIMVATVLPANAIINGVFDWGQQSLALLLVLHPASSQTITGYSLANLIRASCVLNCQLIFAHSALRLTVHIRTCCLKLSKSGHGFPNAWRLMMPISISAMSSQLPCFGV